MMNRRKALLVLHSSFIIHRSSFRLFGLEEPVPRGRLAGEVLERAELFPRQFHLRQPNLVEAGPLQPVGHLERLPAQDAASREIVAKMREDEARHGETGRGLGAADLPYPVKRAMQATSRIMTRTAYWV